MPERSAEELAAELRMISRRSCGTIEEVCKEAADMIDFLNNFQVSQCEGICDSICRWPRQVQSQGYLDNICENCVVSKCLRKSGSKVKTEVNCDA